MYQDILRETWAYQGILREGLEEGREQGLQEGRQEGLQQGREEGLQELRQTLTRVVEARFPLLAPLAKQHSSGIHDAAVLESLIVKISSVQTSEEAELSILTSGTDTQEN